jgi:hypothetical protein
MACIRTHLPVSPTDLIIEPSAGNGAFIPAIKQLTSNHLFFDIHPEHPEITKQDFLTYEFKTFDTHLIGNPPFGRQSSTAVKFIKHGSCCKSISFILPKSFKKESMVKRAFPPNFHLTAEIDLPDKSFLVNGVEHTVPCVFQIWIKKDTVRETLPVQTPNKFVIVKPPQPYDISIRRVGVNAGLVMPHGGTCSPSSNYLVRFTGIDAKLAIQKLMAAPLPFTFDNTVGPKSISQPELIKMLNSILSPVL